MMRSSPTPDARFLLCGPHGLESLGKTATPDLKGCPKLDAVSSIRKQASNCPPMQTARIEPLMTGGGGSGSRYAMT